MSVPGKISTAEVAELADALASGASGSNPIGVQIPASAPSTKPAGTGLSQRFPRRVRSTVTALLIGFCATHVRRCHRSTERANQALKYTHDNDCSDDCSPGTKRALSLRLHPQIQALLSVEGRRRRERRARPGCVPEPRSVNGDCCYDANPATKGANGSALEGEDGSWICPARAWSSQGRRELGNLDPPFRSRAIRR